MRFDKYESILTAHITNKPNKPITQALDIMLDANQLYDLSPIRPKTQERGQLLIVICTMTKHDTVLVTKSSHEKV